MFHTKIIREKCIYFVLTEHILFIISARSQYWIMLGRLGFSLFQLKLSIIYTDNFCLVSLSYVERDNKKRKQNMFPFDFFVIDHFVANFDQKMLEKRDIKKNIFSMALGRTYAWISIFFLLQIRSESIKITCIKNLLDLVRKWFLLRNTQIKKVFTLVSFGVLDTT